MGTCDTSYDCELLKNSPPGSFQKYESNSSKDKITITLNTDRVKLETFFTQFSYLSTFVDSKEAYYILAINNLLKKNNYLSLIVQLSQEQISEDEYVKEIEENSDKYLLDIKYLDDPNDLKIINEIVKKIGVSFSIDEVAEIFSLDSEDIENNVLKINS